jgi:hypothetical protein
MITWEFVYGLEIQNNMDKLSNFSLSNCLRSIKRACP